MVLIVPVTGSTVPSVKAESEMAAILLPYNTGVQEDVPFFFVQAANMISIVQAIVSRRVVCVINCRR